MKKSFALMAFALSLLPAMNAVSAPLPKNNFVVFNVQGDCQQEDCMNLMRLSLRSVQYAITSEEMASLAQHQTNYYKTITLSFTDLKTAPYAQVMEKIASLGYTVVSYVIHDTHTGRDVIVPH